MKHGVAHLLAAGRSAEARALVLENVAWLMARSGDGLGMMEDCRRLVAAAGEGGDRAVDLVRRALDLSMPELRQDPRRLPGQLVGRLMGSGAGSLVATRPAAGGAQHRAGSWCRRAGPAAAAAWCWWSWWQQQRWQQQRWQRRRWQQQRQ